jgi:NADPH:quinone reductase-like Zn-dependent oxidoreductase
MAGYKQILVTHRGGIDAMRVVDAELRAPAAGQARIKVLAVPVCQDDIAARVGNRPFLPKLPFVPGYAAVGVVDAVAPDVTEVRVGDRVAALMQYGGYAEFIYWMANELVKVPEDLEVAEVAPILLNYLVAYQVLNRVLKAKAGEKALLIGSSGGVGTAFLQMGALAKLQLYGLASPLKHKVLWQYGAIPIDYHAQDFVEVLSKAEPRGIDYVLNGMSSEYVERGLAVLRRGGIFVHYGGPVSFGDFLRLIAKMLFYTALPNGTKVVGYGTHTHNVEEFKRDWSQLFAMLHDGRIQPVIDARFPLLEAAGANELLASGKVVGNVVLLSPDGM